MTLGKLRLVMLLSFCLLSAAIQSLAQTPTLPSVWSINGSGDPTIQGFATDISVNVGDTVHFKINSTNATAYTMSVYRMGYYGGDGAALIATISPSATLPQTQPACLTDPSTFLIDCGNWAESATWAVPSNAKSGIYFVKLIRTDTQGSSHIFFVVRNDSSHSDILFQTSDLTWQAYNPYGGHSLYGDTTFNLANRAFKVSYNRPFNTASLQPPTWVFNGEYPMIRWLEQNGYDVTYTTGMDTDRRGSLILNHKIFMSSGHDEYWSGNQRANVEAARNAGVHLAFFSGNEMFWKTRWENSIDGTNTTYRTLVCYKETTANAKTDPTSTWTGTWRDPRFSPPSDGGRPENAVTGTFFMVTNTVSSQNLSILVPAEDGTMRFWRNTTVATQSAGQTATLPLGTLGYEWDSELDNGFRPAGLFHLSTSTYTVTGASLLQDYGTNYGAGAVTHNMTMYRAASGALVFGAGTVQWANGLSDAVTPDLRVQQATVNVLADMGAQPTSLQSTVGTLVAATQSTDTFPPSSVITFPTTGSVVQAGSMLTITGTATDSGGGVVAGVEVSVDGGATWHPATGRSSWQYSWVPNGAPIVTIKSRAVDDSGNIQTSPATATVSLTNSFATIWNATATPWAPDAGDPTSIELGLKFRSDTAGIATGVLFYKSLANTGTHTGSLWSSAGTLLATVTFGSESASGWQSAQFSAPVAVSANTTYVVSYHTGNGHYGALLTAFQTSGVDNSPLHALANGVDGSNGVFVAGSGGGFPNQTFNAANYWVDVAFQGAPSITSFLPSSAGAGAAVTITGTYFSPATTVTFNGATASFVVNSATQITATVPANATTGPIAVTTPAGTATSASNFTFVPAPTISLFTPTGGGIGAAVTITGTNFTAATAVTFNGATASFTVNSATQISATVPSAATSGPIAVTTLGGTATSASSFTFNPLATIGSFSPTNGPIGTFVTITGTFFTGATAVKFNGVTASFSVISDTQISTSVPQGGSTGHIAVTAPGGTVTSGSNFTVTASLTPAISSFSPASGSVATQVTITGTNLIGASVVKFNGVSAVFTVNSTTQITATVPQNAATGAITVTTPGGIATSASNFAVSNTVWNAAPTPAVVDSLDVNSIELGLKFRSDFDGVVTGMLFYKNAANTGSHVGNLWSDAGTLLATVTFANESASGWQAANFSSPIAISANTTYVVSYHAGAGHYSFDSGAFALSGADNAPLHALANGIDGGNGVYLYGTGGFPNQSFNANNYWVDVAFQVAGPTITGVTASAATTTAAIAWTTNVASSSRIDYGTSPGSLTTNFTNSSLVTAHSINLTGLAASTQYYYRVTSVDASANSSTSPASPNSPGTFSTIDSLPPVITSVTATQGPAGTATITWTTNKVSNSRVDYGTASGSLTSNVSDSSLVTAHSIHLSALTQGTTYFFRVTSVDALSDSATSPNPPSSPANFAENAVLISVWSAAATPAVLDGADPNAIELGLKFRSDLAGTVNGVQFYKSAANTGTHVGSLWSSAGTLLAAVTFTSETASGWQQANFSSPVAISANTTYIISYHTSAGHYSFNAGYFSSSGADNTPLHALASGVDGGNGVYLYGGGGFPSSTFNASNYWVDVIFQATPLAEPVITAVAATAGATSATVTWTTDEAASSRVDYGTSAGSLTSNVSIGTLVSSHSVTLTGLSPNTQYFFRVTSVDSAANTNTSPASPNSPATFTTIDTTNPVISSITVTSKLGGYAAITWTTNKASTSQVIYGTSSGSLNLNVTDATLVTSHSITLQGLTQGTTYFYRVTSADVLNDTSTSPNPPSSPNSFAETSAPTSIWPLAPTPGITDWNDANGVELGVKFRSDVSASVTGVRFYKSANNTGTHVGNLWSSNGTLLATVTFSGETASGWQQASFSPPVSISANTTYVVSYHTNTGHYSADSGYFSVAGADNAPLHALANGVDGGNGVYQYGAGGFPNQSFNANNYWVDVVAQ